MRQLYTVAVLTVTIACIAAQLGGGRRRGASGGAEVSNDLFAEENSLANVEAADRQAINANAGLSSLGENRQVKKNIQHVTNLRYASSSSTLFCL